jgi:hypothetical protein
MSMQADVKAYYVKGIPTQPIINSRCRIKGLVISPSGSANTLNFYDGTSIYNVLKLSIDITTSTALVSIQIPSEGILFETGVFYAPTTTDSTTFTIFYG